MAKTREYECPKCAEYSEVDATLEEGLGLVVDESGEDYNFVSLSCKCATCGHEWKEFARLQFDGYASEGKYYDKNGEVIDYECI